MSCLCENLYSHPGKILADHLLPPNVRDVSIPRRYPKNQILYNESQFHDHVSIPRRYPKNLNTSQRISSVFRVSIPRRYPKNV
jgi:hypothetical protein